jgi:hypothetical protein
LLHFRYFFTRKLFFLRESDALGRVWETRAIHATMAL